MKRDAIAPGSRHCQPGRLVHEAEGN
jgi:hypothetical protein